MRTPAVAIQNQSDTMLNAECEKAKTEAVVAIVVRHCNCARKVT
jgi:hypothetical protein